MAIDLTDQAYALLGGVLVGTSTAWLLAFEGVTEGVSGMAAGLASGPHRERWRRAAFLTGLAGAGALGHWLAPHAFVDDSGRPLWAFAAAGLLVGYGARLANGCTSGHGVLGISRGATRSIVAVCLFGLAAMAVEHVFPARAAHVQTPTRLGLETRTTARRVTLASDPRSACADEHSDCVSSGRGVVP